MQAFALPSATHSSILLWSLLEKDDQCVYMILKH